MTSFAQKIYEHDGKKFVETGEIRPPRVGDWYYSPTFQRPFYSLFNHGVSQKILREHTDVYEQIYTDPLTEKKYVKTGERRSLRAGDFWLSSLADNKGSFPVCGPAIGSVAVREIVREYVAPQVVTAPADPDLPAQLKAPFYDRGYGESFEYTGEYRVPKGGEYYWYAEEVLYAHGTRRDSKFIMRPVAPTTPATAPPPYNLRHFNSQTGEGVELVRTFTRRVPLEGEYFLAKSGRVTHAHPDQRTKRPREILRVVGPVSVAGGGEVEKLRELLYKATNELAVAKRKLKEAQNLASIDAGTIRVAKAQRDVIGSLRNRLDQAKRELDRNAQQRDDLHDEFRAYRVRVEKAVKG